MNALLSNSLVRITAAFMLLSILETGAPRFMGVMNKTGILAKAGSR
ncbi:MAG: hypothetical protein U1C96_02440 [Gallionella sp.]|nr:hypothetical protein [Gallionella sp.]